MRITADIIDEELYPDDQLPINVDDPLPTLRETVINANNNNVCQFEKVHEMTQQFKTLRVSDILARASKAMEKEDVAKASSSFETAPAWLIQHLKKMKEEIKKEVMEELLAQGEFQIPRGVIAARLDKNHSCFRGDVVHEDIFCDNCDQLIHGIRYKCGNCSDFDLCQECESLPNIHNKNHVFLKIRYPVALKLYQKQKWHELMASTSGKIYAMSSKKDHSKKLYAAKFICDKTVPDGTVLAPSTEFEKSWKVINSGTRVWTHATKLQLIQGSADLVPTHEQVDVPHLKPGEEGIVSVNFTTPSTPGVYRSHWNFCHKSRPFGDIVWCHIIVKSGKEENAKTTESEDLQGKSDNVLCLDIHCDQDVDDQRKEITSIAQVLTAVKEKHDRGNIVPRKLAVSSHTATPNNTPFDLTPPKSPDHHESVKELQEALIDKPGNDSDNEDGCSIVSLSSSESDTEFVVIPMPKCFNLSESIVSQHIPHLAQYLHTETGADQSKKLERVKLVPVESLQQNIIKKSETVSQETGVPELSEHTDEVILTVAENGVETEKKINISHVSADGSSSEVSIIESGDNSPIVEDVMPTIDSINIAVSNDVIRSKSDIVYEVKYPVPEVFKDDTQLAEKSNKVAQTEESTSDILYNASFPKFPVEGITSEYEPMLTSNACEERTIQVLPEGLVTGALSAAASVYNTARAVISTMQQPRNERDHCLSQELPPNADARLGPSRAENYHSATLNPIHQLVEMGFCNREQNEQLLEKHKGDVALVVAELVNLNDNDWYASRHASSPSASFD
ncbi:next to BRCA1 gene 1 protein-like isoform X1 [Stegodyphus dumicola]|uniref:next to BRCA1 gene 1 protein-like isoform X1 n=1 Tax=Stegodyphus dumicola TaxID=202533 RepID=UPI0015ACFC22|nr:next to BRCA1 gene 1 protein-like isoform X1 [Stegodyphus dumicola]